MSSRRRGPAGRAPENLQVTTTVDSRAKAQRIGRICVDRRLAACAQVVGPIRSTYRWKGSIETAREWMCVLKTQQRRYLALERAIREVHPYDVPEIVAVALVAVSEPYRRWLSGELSQPVKRARSRSR